MTLDSDDTMAVNSIGRYQIFDELGRGAMGVVYRGYDPVIGRTVALKTMIIGSAGAEARELRERLYREAAAAGALSHPNIVTIFDVVEAGGTTAVAMEFIEGTDLAAVIAQRGPLPLDIAVDLFDQICQALDYAGGHGVVHRDIKPANILLTAEGRVKVTDFGVARLALSTLTQAGTVLGSPSYMSPEQVRGLPVDSRSDIFSAAVVFYEMITRERPFGGNDVATTMYRIAHEPPAPIAQFNPAVSPDITGVIEHALQKNPDDRYQSGSELVAELRQAVDRAVLPVSPPLLAILEGLVPQPASHPSTHGSTPKVPAISSSSGRRSGVLTPVSAPVPEVPVPAAVPAPTTRSDHRVPTGVEVTLPSAAPVAAPAVAAVPVIAASPAQPDSQVPSPAEAVAPRTARVKAPLPVPAPAAQQVKRRSTGGFVLGFIGAAAVLALVVAGVFWVRGQQRQAPSDSTATPTETAASATGAPAPGGATSRADGTRTPAEPGPAAASGGSTTPPPPPPPVPPARTPDLASSPARPLLAPAAAAGQVPAAGARGGRIAPPPSAGGRASSPAPQQGKGSGKPGPMPSAPAAPPAPVAIPEPPPQTAVTRLGPAYEATQVDERPVALTQVEPEYPPEARRRGIEDIVVLRLLVTSTGHVADVQVLRKSQKDPGFDGAAVAAVRQWTFRPARRRGETVACWFNVGVPFKIPK